jgi:galactonate dehydratase
VGLTDPRNPNDKSVKFCVDVLLNVTNGVTFPHMKISAVKTYIVPSDLSKTDWAQGKAWVLVKLETDAGISGWGQAYTFHQREQAIASVVHQLSPILDGMDPFSIRRFVTTAPDSIIGAGKEIASAMAGIEIALWDIVGKALSVPAHRLLGGPCRDRVGVYANCWSDIPRSPDELANFAALQVKQGFKAVKVYPFLYGATVGEGAASLEAVRDTVGPDVSIFVDMWYRMKNDELPQIMDALRTYGVSWFEGPAEATDVEALARIRTQSNLPVISGETLFEKKDFLRLLEHKAADTLNPDVALCGILGTIEIATMVDAYSANVSVHNDNCVTIGLAAAMQAAAIIPNANLVEYFPRFEKGPRSFSSFQCQLGDDGCLSLSQESGLGVTVDEAIVCAMEYKPDLGEM